MRDKGNACNVRESVSLFVKRLLRMEPKQWFNVDYSERQREYRDFQLNRISQMGLVEKNKDF